MTTQTLDQEHRDWKRKFFAIWGGQAFSLLGSQLVQFAIIWYLTERTGSASVLAMASMAGLLPGVFLSPFIGVLVDRWNRKKIMIVADTAIALITFAMLILFALDIIEVWHVYVILFIRAIGGSFHNPAMTATTTLMVPHEHMTRIQGINQTLNGGLNIISAPLGALLLELLPMSGIVAIDVISAAFAILPLFLVDIPQPEPMQSAEGKKQTFFQEMREGFQYIIGWPGLMIVIGMATMINFLLSPAFSLMPLLVKSHFSGGAIQLGWLNAVFGVGVILGGILLSVWGGFKRRILTVTLGLIGIGLGSMTLGILPPGGLTIAMGAMLLLGIMLPIANGSLGALMQTTIDPAIQGRVLTLVGSAATAMIPIGLAAAGPLSDALGIQIWFVISGLMCLIMAILQILIPAVVNIEQSPQVLARKQAKLPQETAS
ncbi:MAG TPA: MFS transporter [Anaerolineae bacterium]|nr:MFS transporter [Anaerolineae bacterium]